MFRYLEPGDSIAVVAPASAAPLQRYSEGLALLDGRYQLVAPYQPENARPATLPYLANDDDERVARFNAAIDDPAVRAIFAARGGYGCTRIIERLNLQKLAARRLPLIGFSDLTVLHAALQRQGAVSVHGPVVNQLAVLPDEQVEGLFALLEGRALPRLDGLSPLREGQARGPLRGGNVAMLAALCGTPWQPSFDGCIALLEDVGEVPYRLDRLLTQLLAAGVFKGVEGIVLGDFIDCDAPQGIPPRPVSALTVLEERLAPLGVPIAAGATVGHGSDNVGLPLGLEANLDATTGVLTFDEERDYEARRAAP